MQYELKYRMMGKVNKIYYSLLCYSLLLLPGAGSGIGRAVCQVLAREGAKVIAADQNGMAAQETKGLISGKTETYTDSGAQHLRNNASIEVLCVLELNHT